MRMLPGGLEALGLRGPAGAFPPYDLKLPTSAFSDKFSRITPGNYFLI
jgi:hypothetical protein